MAAEDLGGHCNVIWASPECLDTLKMTRMTLLQAARAYRSANPPKYGLQGVTSFIRQAARNRTDPNDFSERDWEKVFDEFGVEDDAERIALLEDIAAWL